MRALQNLGTCVRAGQLIREMRFLLPSQMFCAVLAGNDIALLPVALFDTRD